jgi:hypothetical protein
LRKNLKGSQLRRDHKVVSTWRHNETISQAFAYLRVEVSGIYSCNLSPRRAAIARFRYVHGLILKRNSAAQVRSKTPYNVRISPAETRVAGYGFNKITGELVASWKAGYSMNTTVIQIVSRSAIAAIQ